MTMQTKQQTQRPSWATVIAVGFFIAGFGLFFTALGLLFEPVMASIGGAIATIGLMVGCFGGYGYFISYRAKSS